jgi:23S rRNA (guanosine2251-2'-O)-methyltransferase
VLAVLQGRRHVHSVMVAEGTNRDARLQEIRDIADSRKITLSTVDVQQIENVVGKVNHQGVLATCDRFAYTPLAKFMDRPGPVLVLDHVSDPQNLGTLLRAGLAFDIAGVVIPSDRSASVTPAVVNASAGAVERVPVAQVVNVNRAIADMKSAGRWVVGLDTGEDSRSIYEAEVPTPVALVLGSEGRGISRQVRSSCDLIVSIPIAQTVESLNVATAGSIVLYDLARRQVLAGRAED